MNEWLSEQLKTIRNLCDIALAIQGLGEMFEDKDLKEHYQSLLPTLFELMLVEIQQVVDENCVVKE